MVYHGEWCRVALWYIFAAECLVGVFLVKLFSPKKPKMSARRWCYINGMLPKSRGFIMMLLEDGTVPSMASCL
jgi:hypothetical protein